MNYFNNSNTINRSKPSAIEKLLRNFDLSTPVDFKQAVKGIHGDKRMFNKMLERLEVMSLNSCMEQIAAGMMHQNWTQIKNAAHTLKGSTGYLGAGYIYYACVYIMQAHGEEDFVGMTKYYPLLVEAVVEFKRYSRKLLAE